MRSGLCWPWKFNMFELWRRQSAYALGTTGDRSINSCADSQRMRAYMHAYARMEYKPGLMRMPWIFVYTRRDIHDIAIIDVTEVLATVTSNYLHQILQRCLQEWIQNEFLFSGVILDMAQLMRGDITLYNDVSHWLSPYLELFQIFYLFFTVDISHPDSGGWWSPGFWLCCVLRKWEVLQGSGHAHDEASWCWNSPSCRCGVCQVWFGAEDE